MYRPQSSDKEEIVRRSQPERRRTKHSHRTIFDRYDVTDSRDRNAYSRQSLAVPSIPRRASSTNERREDTHDIRRSRSNAGAREDKRGTDGLKALQDTVKNCLDSLQDLEEICRDKDEATPAGPDQLTFTKIADQAEDHHFRLKIWADESGLRGATRVLFDDADSIKTVQNSVGSLEDTTEELIDLCEDAHSSDLVERHVHDEDDESLASQIQENLWSNESLIRSLHLLFEPLTEILELAPKKEPETQMQMWREPEVMNQGPKQALRDAAIIQEIVTYFGSEESLRKYPVNPKYEGSKALSAARELYGPRERRHTVPQPKLPEPGRFSELTFERVESHRPDKTPIYIKVSQKHVDPLTLAYYGLEWEPDPHDPEYMVILENLDDYDTQMLFAHTRRLRSMPYRSEGLVLEISPSNKPRERTHRQEYEDRERRTSHGRRGSGPRFSINID